MKYLIFGILLFFLIILWLVVLLHPIVISVLFGNPLWLLLYLAIIPEIIIAMLISTIVLALLNSLYD